MSTIYSRKNVDSICRALVQQYNALHDSVAVSDGYGSSHYHRDISGVPTGDFSAPSSSVLAVSAASAVDLPSTIVLANNLLGVLQAHVVDDSAHLKADVTAKAALAALVLATDLASVKTLINGMQTAYEAHRTASGVHVANDSVNTWTGSAVVDLGTSEAAAILGKTVVNDHILTAPTVGRIKLIDG